MAEAYAFVGGTEAGARAMAGRPLRLELDRNRKRVPRPATEAAALGPTLVLRRPGLRRQMRSSSVPGSMARARPRYVPPAMRTLTVPAASEFCTQPADCPAREEVQRPPEQAEPQLHGPRQTRSAANGAEPHIGLSIGVVRDARTWRLRGIHAGERTARGPPGGLQRPAAFARRRCGSSATSLAGCSGPPPSLDADIGSQATSLAGCSGPPPSLDADVGSQPHPWRLFRFAETASSPAAIEGSRALSWRARLPRRASAAGGRPSRARRLRGRIDCQSEIPPGNFGRRQSQVGVKWISFH